MKKISSYQHVEYDNDEIKNKNNLEEKIRNKLDIFGRNYKYKKVTIDKNFAPDYIIQNQDDLSYWIDE